MLKGTDLRHLSLHLMSCALNPMDLQVPLTDVQNHLLMYLVTPCQEIPALTQFANRHSSICNANHAKKHKQGAVEDIQLPPSDFAELGLSPEPNDADNPHRVVDIMISEWMGYFLLRESMLDSLVRARDKFLKPATGIMMPSHATMLLAPIVDEEERRAQHNEYAAAMEDWKEFAQTTQNVYGVDMSVLERDFDREQKEYYVLSSRWAELGTGCLLAG